MSRKHLTTKQVIDINDILRQKLIRKENGLVAYVDGWNDQKVAQQIGGHDHQVAKVRQKVFGNLMTLSKPGTSIKFRLENLEKRVTELEAIITNPRSN